MTPAVAASTMQACAVLPYALPHPIRVRQMSLARCAVPAPRRGFGAQSSDAALAAHAASDSDAFAVLYERYASRIYRMIYGRLRDRESAEDVTSEVFLKALRGIACYSEARAPFWAWLHRIASNAVVDHMRARRMAVPLDVVPDHCDPTTDVESAAISRVEAGRAWQVIDELCGAQRTAVTLRLGADLPICDIAGHMERSEGAVKLLLNRGMTTVRARMA